MDAMGETQARQRLLEGGYFVALSVPAGVEFGIDLKSYETGPQFKGVKMIPAGLHFAHYGTGEGEKQGYFFRSGPRTIATTQWDALAEDLVNAEVSLPAGSLGALRESVLRLEMDANLGPYPFEQQAAWLNLTNCVTDSVLERCGIPTGAKVLAGSSAAEPGEPGGAPLKSSGSDVLDDDADTGGGVEGMEIVPHFPHLGRVAKFCDLPGRPASSSPSTRDRENAAQSTPIDPQEVTKRNMDGSDALNRLIAEKFDGKWMELLGELQLSFVLFVSLSSLSGFRHWQALSAMLCRCGDAIATNPALFTAFVRMLHAHLKLVPEDFFDVELSKDNFLVPCLSALVQNILPDKTLEPSVIDATRRLLKFLQQRFGLFLSEGGDSLALLPEDQRQRRLSRHERLPLVGPRPQLSAGSSGTQSTDYDSGLEAFMQDEEYGVGQDDQRATTEIEMESTEGLSLMQLELDQEDQPAVVPYEEVMKALGDQALQAVHINGTDETGDDSRQTPASDTADTPSARSHMDEDGNQKEHPSYLSAPSAKHSERWNRIDRILSTAVEGSSRAGGAVTPAPPPPHPASGLHAPTCTKLRSSSTEKPPAPADLVRRSDSSIRESHANNISWAAAAAEAAGGYAAVVAKRYPLLFANTGPKEDVLMAAARLVSAEIEGKEGEGEEVAAVAEAVTFLEEIGARQDGGAAVLRLSPGPRVGGSSAVGASD